MCIPKWGSFQNGHPLGLPLPVSYPSISPSPYPCLQTECACCVTPFICSPRRGQTNVWWQVRTVVTFVGKLMHARTSWETEMTCILIWKVVKWCYTYEKFTKLHAWDLCTLLGKIKKKKKGQSRKASPRRWHLSKYPCHQYHWLCPGSPIPWCSPHSKTCPSTFRYHIHQSRSLRIPASYCLHLCRWHSMPPCK